MSTDFHSTPNGSGASQRLVIARVRLPAAPAVRAWFPENNRIGARLLAELIARALPESTVLPVGPLNVTILNITTPDHRQAIQVTLATLAKFGLEIGASIFWWDAADGVFRSAYPDQSLRLTMADIIADFDQEGLALNRESSAVSAEWARTNEFTTLNPAPAGGAGSD